MFSEKHKILGEYYHTVLSFKFYFIFTRTTWSSNFLAPNSNKVLHFGSRPYFSFVFFFFSVASEEKTFTSTRTHAADVAFLSGGVRCEVAYKNCFLFS